uniref:Sulfotransferase domain-containing protein n=1 Tax=Rheinheimera sp. BAL341 TaxID=1708203 RepID=A0A486XWA6_9GAMM
MSDRDAPDIYIHIGYPKTATTWLQNDIFPHHPDFCFISNRYKLTDWGVHLVSANSLSFDADWVRREVFAVSEASGKNKILISWEHLLGDSFFNADHLVTLAERLKLCFPNARIIIYLREQFALLRSLYAQYVQEGGTWSLASFVQLKYPYRVGFDPVYLDYANVIALYKHLFGHDNIYISLYEKLKAQPKDELSALFCWMALPDNEALITTASKSYNVSLSRQSLHVMRFLNCMVPSRFNSFGPVLFRRQPQSRTYLRKWMQEFIDPMIVRKIFTRHQLELPQSLQERLSSYYSESNAAISSDLNIDLTAYGYCSRDITGTGND